MANRSGEALIVIDVQNDFCPGGALAVPDGDAVVSGINEIVGDFEVRVFTQDWHPQGHSSFASSYEGRSPFEAVTLNYGMQTLWPDHCIQGAPGADFHSDLLTDRADMVLRKGFRSHIDSYSAFFENDRKTPTGLEGYLRTRGVENIVCVGLATDFCVYFSAIDAARLGFGVEVIESCCRAIDLEGSLQAACDGMKAVGVTMS